MAFLRWGGANESRTMAILVKCLNRENMYKEEKKKLIIAGLRMHPARKWPTVAMIAVD